MTADELNPQVLSMVRAQFQRPSPPSTAALYGRAIRIDSSIRDLTLRQFNAKYRLRVKRELSRNGPKEDGRNRERASVDRNVVRDVLIRFARDVVAAEGTAGVLDVLMGVDVYVEDILKL